MEWLLISWITCGVFSAIIANSKGRSGFSWLVLGLIFGIFALLAVGFMPALKAQEATQKADTEERKCPFCAEMIKAEAKVCKHCGRDVEPEIKKLAPIIPKKSLVCPHCGKSLSSDPTYCHSCQKDTGIKIYPHCRADCSEYPNATACHACHRFFNEGK